MTGNRALLLVALAYALVQFAAVDLQRYLNYDEAVYYSQIAHGVEPIFFSASRSRGIAWLLAPIVALEPSLYALRLGCVALHSILLWLTYRAWLPALGSAAAVAAALFAGSWITVFYGSEISPNLPAGLFALLALGTLCASEARGAVRWGLGAACFGWAAMLRPSDTLVLCAASLGILTAVDRARLRWVAPALIAGTALGWLPWVVEAWQRFGGVSERLREAARLAESHAPLDTLLWYARMHDGPLYSRHPTGPIVWQGVAWSGVFVLFGLVGWIGSLRDPTKRSAVVAGLAGMALFVAYLFTAAARPRYLLPVYALLSVPAGFGLGTLVRAMHARSLAAAIALVVLIAAPALVWHARTLRDIDRGQSLGREADRRDGDVLLAASAGQPCAAAIQWSLAPIAVRAGCSALGHWGKDTRRVERFVEDHACAGERVFAMARAGHFRHSSLGSWKSVKLRGDRRLYVPPEQGLAYCRRIRSARGTGGDLR